MPPSRPSSGAKPLPSDAQSSDRRYQASARPQIPVAKPTSESKQRVHYTVFIRLPFPRGEFIDPPPVDWNAKKEKQLWSKLSLMSKGNDIDWQALADEFDVTLQFLLQQAAWLYERQLSQVRAQMRKVGQSSTSTAASPIAGSVSASTMAGGYPMKRGASGGGASGGYPMRRDGSGQGAHAVTAGGHPMRRDLSGGATSPVIGTKREDIASGKATTATVGGYAMKRDGSGGVVDVYAPSGKKPASVLSSRSRESPLSRAEEFSKQNRPSSEALAAAPFQRPSVQATKRRPSALAQVIKIKTSPEATQKSPSSSNAAISSSSDSSSSDSSTGPTMRKSLAFKRPTRFAPPRRRLSSPFQISNSRDGDVDPDDDAEESDSDAAFLPFSEPATAKSKSSKTADTSATLRDVSRKAKGPEDSSNIESSASSANSSSAAAVSASSPTSSRRLAGNTSPTYSRIPPHRRQLSRQQIPSRPGGVVNRRHGSEDTPTSMGSSFSDLDDAGVSKSGAEEALAGGKTGVASRMSTIGQALKSRYL